MVNEFIKLNLWGFPIYRVCIYLIAALSYVVMHKIKKRLYFVPIVLLIIMGIYTYILAVSGCNLQIILSAVLPCVILAFMEFFFSAYLVKKNKKKDVLQEIITYIANQNIWKEIDLSVNYPKFSTNDIYIIKDKINDFFKYFQERKFESEIGILLIFCDKEGDKTSIHIMNIYNTEKENGFQNLLDEYYCFNCSLDGIVESKRRFNSDEIHLKIIY